MLSQVQNVVKVDSVPLDLKDQGSTEVKEGSRGFHLPTYNTRTYTRRTYQLELEMRLGRTLQVSNRNPVARDGDGVKVVEKL